MFHGNIKVEFRDRLRRFNKTLGIVYKQPKGVKMEFKTRYAKEGVKDTKTEVILNTGELSLDEWCKDNMTPEEYDHALWYGVGLEFLKAKLKGLSDADVLAKVKILWEGSVTVRFNVPVAQNDEVSKLLKSDKDAVTDALVKAGLLIKDVNGQYIRVKK